MAKTEVIEVEKISKSYTLGKNKFDIIKGIDFTIHSGEYIIIFGPSGCGKSTILYVISGLELPTEGKLIIRGEDVSKYNPDEMAKFRQSKIGFVFQQFNLLRNLKVKENVALPLIAAGKTKKQALHRAVTLLNVFGLSKHIDKVPSELSGGQQQRVSMARALAANPWILICDEPTGNLDSKSANEVMDILYILNRKSKRTVITVTHNPDYLKYASRVFYVKDGAIDKIVTNRNRPVLKNVEDFTLSSTDIANSEK